MGEFTSIEWCDHTFNPWRGCTKVSAGCEHCYAERQAKRNPAALGEWGPNGTRAMAAESYWMQPIRWNGRARDKGTRYRVFLGSMMDFFEDRPELLDARARVFDLIRLTQHLDWLILTKRPENWARTLRATLDRMRERGQRIVPLLPNQSDWQVHTPSFVNGWLHGDYPGAGHVVPRNVWLGTSVENQAAADERIPHLLKCPAAVRFLSCEPLLGPVNLRLDAQGVPCNQYGLPIGRCGYYCDESVGHVDHGSNRVHWVIAAGESGPQARPCHPDWIRSIRDQCQVAGMPFFFKQWGEWLEEEEAMRTIGDDACALLSKRCIVRDNTIFVPVGKKAAGRMLDGREWNEWPKT